MDFLIYSPSAYLDPPFIRFSENFPPSYYLDPPFNKHQRVLQIIVDSTYIHIYVSKGTKSKDSYLGSLKGYKRNNKITFNLNIVCIQSRFLLATSSRGIKISSK